MVCGFVVDANGAGYLSFVAAQANEVLVEVIV